MPPIFDRIYRYIAVDEFRLEHVERWIGRARTELIYNAVDITRLPPRPSPLNERPRRALAFTKYASHLPALRIACRRRGLTFEALGRGVDRIVDDPENYLVKADIVFAVDRSAIEAICAGSAVVVIDRRGLGEMAATENYDKMRGLNFGTRLLARPVSLSLIEKELDRFDATDATAVSQRLRDDADLEKAVNRVEQLYVEAIAENRGKDRTADDARDLAAFLERWPVPMPLMDQWSAERDYLTAVARRTVAPHIAI